MHLHIHIYTYLDLLFKNYFMWFTTEDSQNKIMKMKNRGREKEDYVNHYVNLYQQERKTADPFKRLFTCNGCFIFIKLHYKN